MGYKINDNSKIIAGLNPVPFGLGRFWGNTYYLGIANSAGWEDVHNLGVKYDFNDGINEAQLAFILPMVAPIEVKAKTRVDLVSILSMQMTLYQKAPIPKKRTPLLFAVLIPLKMS